MNRPFRISPLPVGRPNFGERNTVTQSWVRRVRSGDPSKGDPGPGTVICETPPRVLLSDSLEVHKGHTSVPTFRRGVSESEVDTEDLGLRTVR